MFRKFTSLYKYSPENGSKPACFITVCYNLHYYSVMYSFILIPLQVHCQRLQLSVQWWMNLLLCLNSAGSTMAPRTL